MARCPRCGSTAKRAAVETERVVAGQTFVAVLRTCSACGEADAAELARLDLAIAGELAERGVRTPEAFRAMRLAIGVKAQDLARLFDVRPEQLSRWENGVVPLDVRSFALLGSMVLDALAGSDRTHALLRTLAEPPQVESPVRLTLPKL